MLSNSSSWASSNLRPASRFRISSITFTCSSIPLPNMFTTEHGTMNNILLTAPRLSQPQTFLQSCIVPYAGPSSSIGQRVLTPALDVRYYFQIVAVHRYRQGFAGRTNGSHTCMTSRQVISEPIADQTGGNTSVLLCSARSEVSSTAHNPGVVVV